jgi:hypothetical protein
MEDNAGTNTSSSSEVFWVTHRHEINKVSRPTALDARLRARPPDTSAEYLLQRKSAAAADRNPRSFWRRATRSSKSCSDGSQPNLRTDASEASTSTRTMLATLSLATLSLLPHSHPHPTPATTRLTAYQRMPPPMAMLTRDANAQRRLPRICSTPEAVRAATPPYAAARPLHTPH